MGSSERQIIIIAGEASGDLHAAHLVAEILKQDPHIKFSGVGGEKMRASGVNLFEDISKLAVVGFVEVLKHLSDIRETFHLILKKVQEHKPDAVILVDYPGFNLRLARELKKMGIRVIYYISPQVWAWKENRIKLIKNVVDRMIVLFRFEKDFYARHGVDVSFVGHPLLDTIQVKQESKDFLTSVGLDQDKTTIGILPGSRSKEVERMLPVMLQAAETLTKNNQDLQFLIIKAPTIEETLLQTYLKPYKIPAAITGETYEGIHASQSCLVTSGTATLETAILGKPMVVVYKTSWLSFLLAKTFIKIPFIGMVNVVAGKKIVPECIQAEASAERLAQELNAILNDAAKLKNIKSELSRVKTLLGDSGASGRAAEEILEIL